jgi:uncharacterized protein YmfQ (DUF2313 family)
MTIKEFSNEKTTDMLANFMPAGRATESKFESDSNIRKLLTAQSGEFKRVQDLMAYSLSELDPRTTENYISEWESAIGIPDECIPLESDPQSRRDNIVLKLNSLSVQTESDFQSLALQFGFTITFKKMPHAPEHSHLGSRSRLGQKRLINSLFV